MARAALTAGLLALACVAAADAFYPMTSLSSPPSSALQRPGLRPAGRRVVGGAGSLLCMSSGLSMYERIEQKLAQLNPTKLVVVDNSHMHAGHAGVNGRNGETHFAVEVISEDFEGLRSVQRHQKIYGLLKEEMGNGVDSGIHALQITAKTPSEAEAAPVKKE